jgi:phosphatidate cytidylyltransferase
MLRTRVLTAVVILAVLVAMLFAAPADGWALFVLAAALLAGWEWSRLAAMAPASQAIFLALSGAIGAAMWLLYVRHAAAFFEQLALGGFALAVAFWVLVAPWWLARSLRPAPFLRAVAGWLVVWPTWLAFVTLRDASPWVLLATAALVWIADIAAYFAGRRFGRHKLAPLVSPGKTWEGVAGAFLGVAAYGAALAAIARSHDTPLTTIFAPGHGLPAVGAMLALAALSVEGDLFESWMKRGAGLKDSSRLLPGHGGILDRIDALTATLPVAALAFALAARGAAA